MLRVNLKLKSSFFVFFLLISLSANAQSTRCNANLELLRQDLLSMLKKIPAMPPVVQIYKPVKKLYDEAKVARSRGYHRQCVEKTTLALKYSTPYGRRR